MNYLSKLLLVPVVYIISMASSQAYEINQSMRQKAAMGGLNLDKMMQNNGNDVLVHYNTPDITIKEGKINRQSLDSDVQRFKNVKQIVKSKLGSKAVHLRDYAYSPITFTRFTDNQALLDALNDPNVAYITPNRRYKRNDTPSNLSLIGQPEAIKAGYTGKGTIVAILDSGVDYVRKAFGNCTATSLGSAGCKVLESVDVATNDGMLDDESLHGTNVSGIATMVAPDTKLVVYDIFEPDGSSSDADIIAAYNNIKPNEVRSDGRRFAAINLSSGNSDPYAISAACNNSNYAVNRSIATMKSLGVASVISAGNDGYTNMISYPACSNDAISVGAVYDSALPYQSISYPGANCTDYSFAADKVVCFSNSSSGLSLLAPGANITAADETQFGTSQAAPHVAGALALLKDDAAMPSVSVDQAKSILRSTGKLVTDPRNNITTPRLNIASMVAKINNECLRQGKTLSESLSTNEILCSGDNILSRSKAYNLAMQNDGNLVIYKGGSPLWASNTFQSNGKNRLIMQSDGNLVIYNGQNAPVYNTGSSIGSGVYNLIMQDDGNLVIYKSNKLWSSTGNTTDNSFIPTISIKNGYALTDNDVLLSKNNGYKLVMQSDGNAVVYNTINNSPIYHTRTSGIGAKHNFVMQNDGNLVLYADGRPSFYTNTAGNYSFMNFSDKGELSVAKQVPIWSRF